MKIKKKQKLKKTHKSKKHLGNNKSINFDLFINKVISKGGTTEEAMKILKEKRIIFNKFNTAIQNATKKSILLAKKF